GRFAWEGLTTFYARGQFGEPNADAPPAPAPAVDAPPGPPWRIPAGAALRFAQLTGDYNGLHLSDRYAGWFGYRSAFFHPQRVLGQCLARLPKPDDLTAQRLDAWLKGPVYHHAEVRLAAT